MGIWSGLARSASGITQGGIEKECEGQGAKPKARTPDAMGGLRVVK